VQTLDNDSVTTYMEAEPAVVYELVSDVTRMPEFSPEIRRCTWLDGATGPAVGARFAAVNKVQRGPGWTNKPVVTVVEPGREFAFARTEKFGGTVVWTYKFEPKGTGVRVTESYEVTRPISPIGWFVIGGLFGRKDRRADLRAGMEQTLERMRVVAERASS
jgi:Polyketide cyclase / dehydrase and lipid transport